MKSSPKQDPFAEWRRADQRASDLELAAFNAAIDSLAGKGSAPSQAQWNHAKTAREHARQLFHQVIASVRSDGTQRQDDAS